MAIKNVFVLVALVAGCLAIPTPTEDFSRFFDQTDPSDRLVGASPAPAGSTPYMVALTSGNNIRSFNCGASLISANTVLTAAHCIDPFVGPWTGQLAASLRGVIGTDRWNVGGTLVPFSRFVNHPNWVSSTIKNDIGILITTAPVSLSSVVAPVGLSFAYVDVAPVRVTGWGRIVAGGAIPSELQEIYTNTISGEQCVADAIQASIDLNMNAPPVDPAVEICTFHSAGRGNCNGDSGSALVEVATGLQVGIVSWGFPCALGAPDMFARVSAYQTWLNNNVV